MKKTFAVLLILAGLAAGCYFGLWWAFVGGIVQIIGQVRAPEVSAMAVGIGVAKIAGAGIIGTVCVTLGVLPGLALLKD